MERVFLFGDHIRMGCGRYVREGHAGLAEIYYARENPRFAADALLGFDKWIEAEVDPRTVTMIHFNCGTGDMTRLPDGETLTPMNIYLDNVLRVIARMQKLCPRARIIFATATPVVENLYDRPLRIHRTNEDTIAYNKAAVSILGPMGIKINDLYEACGRLTSASWNDAENLNTNVGLKVLSDSIRKSISYTATFI